MSMNSLIADALTRIRNGQKAFLAQVTAQSSKFLLAILAVMKKEGYILGFETREESPGRYFVDIKLSYFRGLPVILDLKMVSKPGCRRYYKVHALKPVRNRLGIQIVSTSQGVMSDNEARSKGIGGEVVCSIF